MNLYIDFDGLNRLQSVYWSAAKTMDKALHSSLKSALFHLRRMLREAVKTNEFGWPKQKAFPTIYDIQHLAGANTRSGVLNAFIHGQNVIFNAKDRPFFGELGRLMFYNYDPRVFAGEVGAVNAKGQNKIGAKGVDIWHKLQSGYSKPVNEDARRFFAGIGIPIRATTTMFNIPARPLFGPVAVKRADQVNRFILATVEDKLRAGLKKTDFLDRTFSK